MGIVAIVRIFEELELGLVLAIVIEWDICLAYVYRSIHLSGAILEIPASQKPWYTYPISDMVFTSTAPYYVLNQLYQRSPGILMG